MKIRICSIITAVALLLGVFPAVGAAESPVYTVDVPVSVDFGQASGVNFTLQLNSLFVEAAEEIEGTRAPELDGKLFALFQKDDQINVGIASDTAFSCGGPLFSLRLTLRQPAGEEDELYKLVKLKVDEEPAWQTDTILLSGVREGGVYNRPVSIAFNEGTALLDGQPFASGGTVDAEGEHNLQVTDPAGRIRSLSFSIDRTPPVITIADYDDTQPSRGPLTVEASVNEGTLNETSHTFTENGTFDFIATDAAGNQSVQSVVITHLYTSADLSLSGAPETPTLAEGELLDIDGWKLEIIYKDKNGAAVARESVPVTEDMLTYAADTPGQQEAVIRWKGEELRFTILVEQAEPDCDKTALGEAILQAEPLYDALDTYGETAVKEAFLQALEEARKVYENPEATQTQADEAAEALQAAAAALSASFKKGDVNRDGSISIQDVMTACRILARNSTGQAPTDKELEVGDMDGDNKILIQDIMSICRVLARQG